MFKIDAEALPLAAVMEHWARLFRARPQSLTLAIGWQDGQSPPLKLASK